MATKSPSLLPFDPNGEINGTVGWSTASKDYFNVSAVAAGVDSNGVNTADLSVTPGGVKTAAIAAAAAASAIKTSAGRLASVMVTTLGTAALSIYDNASAASGTIIGFIPASTAAGQPLVFNMPAANGIFVASGVNTPAVTISYS